MKFLEHSADLCVVGGGLSGLCTALAAARHGIKVILIHDRPVLGGNASSEVRMWIGGCHGDDNRETGIIEELILENYYRNPTSSYSVWDGVLYSAAAYQENLALLLNSSVLDARCGGDTVYSVKAWQSNAETFHTVTAAYFADCSGDSILAPLTGAEYRYGRESGSEFGESIRAGEADLKTMGMSCLLQMRQTDYPVPYTPPEWAYTYETDADLPYKEHGRDTNFWWIEVGGELNCIYDTDVCREELLKIAYGVWDHMKNKGDHGLENWALDWVGFLPGKRESRRYVGEYTVTQNDVENEGRFDDLVAYAGWTMDDHFPKGFYHDGYPTVYHPAPTPWGLPLRCMISRSVRNLVFAGRNISVTHTALSSSRVMATCSLLGQALGTAVAQSVKDGVDVRDLDIPKLQQTLMMDDCWLPWHQRKVSPLSLTASCSDELVRNGRERGADNCWVGKPGDVITYRFEKNIPIKEIRIVFDSDLNRTTPNMPCSYPKFDGKLLVPGTLIKRFRVEGIDDAGKTVLLEVKDCHQRLVRLFPDWNVREVRLIPLETWGCKAARVFSFEVM